MLQIRKDTLSYRQIALKTLGAIWFIDGLLQLQPYMFSKQFATEMLAGTAQGQPHFVLWTVTKIADFLAPHIAAWNAVFALIQLAIGVGLFFKKTSKPTLALSFVWVLGVWWFGEAFGQIFSGNASLLTGAPGAVLVYGIIGLILWPSKNDLNGAMNRAGHESQRPIRSIGSVGVLKEDGAKVLWAVIWVVDGIFQFLPANSGKGQLSGLIQNQANGEPSIFAFLNNHLSSLIHHHGTQVSIVLGIVEIAVGLGVFSKLQNYFVVIGAVFASVVWIGIQDMGGIFTGQGTDPNLGLLLVLFAFCLYRFRSEEGDMVQYGRTVELQTKRLSDNPSAVLRNVG